MTTRSRTTTTLVQAPLDTGDYTMSVGLDNENAENVSDED